MTLIYTRPERAPRRLRISWYKLGVIAINIALWTGIIFATRALH